MKTYKTYQLNPINDRKSFGGKCHVNEYETDGTKYSDLISCGKRVAYYNHEEKFISVHGYFSATTATHINAFLDLFGFEIMTKKQMETKPKISK